jgi:cytochrome c5
MSDAHHHDTDEHESGIKTPKQLIAVILAAFVVPIVVIILLTEFVGLETKRAPGSEALTLQATSQRIQPVGQVTVRDAADVASLRTGEQVFTAQCSACHAAGALGSPKFGDATAWGPRIVKGFDALLNSALHGKGNMPAQSGGDFSDYEIARAVVYMADKGGAKFPEPAAPSPAAAASGAATGGAASASAPATEGSASSPSATAAPAGETRTPPPTPAAAASK